MSDLYCGKTNIYRSKLLVAVRDGTIPPTPTQFVFGGGGHDSETGLPIQANPQQTILNQAYLSKDFESVNTISSFRVDYTGRLDEYELSGYTISEVGLADQDGDLIMCMNFLARVKQSGGAQIFKISHLV